MPKHQTTPPDVEQHDPFTGTRDEATQRLINNPEAYADALLEDAAAASMTPKGLAPHAAAEYHDAVEFLRATIRPLIENPPIMPFSGHDGAPIGGSLAGACRIDKRSGLIRSDADARKIAANVLSRRLHAYEVEEGRRVYAREGVHYVGGNPRDGFTPDLVLYLIAANGPQGETHALVTYLPPSGAVSTFRGDRGDTVSYLDAGQRVDARSIERIFPNMAIAKFLTLAQATEWLDTFDAMRKAEQTVARLSNATDTDPDQETDEEYAPF